ncbi:MAG: kynureninase, partial [Planctomycetota bacterium]
MMLSLAAWHSPRSGSLIEQIMDFKQHFSRSLQGVGSKLHFAAHSHHLWPDVSREAHMRAWDLAATQVDEKWDTIFSSVLPSAKAHIARMLQLSNPDSLAFAPNTHEFLKRIVSCFEVGRAVRILSTDSEFHTFERQTRRWEEVGLAEVVRVPCEDYDSFAARFLQRAQEGSFDLVFVSHVFFNSGFVLQEFQELAHSLPPETVIVLDAYHGFMAIPTDLSAVENRIFYLTGGYKYAMTGEGACFLHCPDGQLLKPVDTGWFAHFGSLESSGAGDAVQYGEHGQRFMGATFDPSALFRMVAVFDWLESIQVSVSDIHAHVRALQGRFLERVAAGELPSLDGASLLPGAEHAERGHFLTFRTERAAELHQALRKLGVITDYRGDRLRFGFGLYHDEADVDALCER